MQTRNATPTLDYITRTVVREPEWLRPVRQRGDALRPGMQMSPFEGHLLRWLAQLVGATNILEIGTFMGGTALWMADSGASVTTLEFSAEYAAEARQHIADSPHASRVKVEQGDALAWLAAQAPAARFDMLFIDAEKRRYPDYLDAALPLLKPGALVVGDNTLLWGALSGEAPDAAKPDAIAAMRRFNERLSDPAEFDGVMLPTPEGLTIARWRG